MDVIAPITYHNASDNATTLRTEQTLLAGSEPGIDEQALDTRMMAVRDGRSSAKASDDPAADLVSGCGYVLADAPTAVTNWYDQDHVRDTYYQEVKALVERLLPPGAVVTPASSHILRDEKELVRDAALQAPARMVHNDFAAGFQEVCCTRDSFLLATAHLFRSESL